MGKVYILLAIHNRKELTLECLVCLHKQTYTNYQVVIVDDGSTDGSKEAILASYPQTKIILGDGSLWWTASMNKGLVYILSIAKDDDLVLTLNDDTEFDKNYLETIVSYATKYPQACIGSLLKNYYQKDLIEDSGVKINWNGYFYYQIPFVESVEIVEPDTLSGRGTLMPIKIFKSIGLFNQKNE
jgi:GT2 family glycosyltransferase